MKEFFNEEKKATKCFVEGFRKITKFAEVIAEVMSYCHGCVVEAYCHPNPCMNDGQCVRVGKSYTCICTPQFKGNHCEGKNLKVLSLSYVGRRFYNFFINDYLLTDIFFSERLFFSNPNF